MPQSTQSSNFATTADFKSDEVICLLRGELKASQAQVQELRQQVKTLEEKVDKLEGTLRKDSHNSSKAPSTDGPKRKTRSLRKKSNLKPGGQKGHPGSTLRMREKVDFTVTHPLKHSNCQSCDRSLAGLTPTVCDEKRQVIDLPPPKVEVTEHRIVQVVCACGTVNCSAFPESVPSAVQYGPRLKATAVLFTQQQHVPYLRTSIVISDLFGEKISTGSIFNWVKLADKKLRPAVAVIAEAIVLAPVANFDETTMRVMYKAKYVHTASTGIYTWLGCHEKRGKVAMDEFNILPRFRGVAVHDGLKSYFKFYLCLHALCNAHHLRELEFVFEMDNKAQAWAQAMIVLLCKAKDEVAEAVAKGTPLGAERRFEIEQEYEELVREGERNNPERFSDKPGKRGRVAQSTAKNLLNRLHKYEACVLRFLENPLVPWDNNGGERALRMSKVHQKISGLFRSLGGLEAFCTIRSYMDTLTKQKRNLFDALVQTFSGTVPSAV